MYKIEAIIRPHLLEAVREALTDLHVVGITASDCRGSGSQRGVTHSFRGSQYGAGLSPRVRLEIVVTNAQLESIVDAIQKAAYTGEVGDGKIWVTALHEVVRIRTNERGDAALDV
ncbi:P-II family nitrogen regulator [Fimbriimonas ginsengisoli]|uniref:Nitrogen regulatory protein P-II n=1 Tax=Fimbriimonas ginsengisoli Gsoil 348 TaxID=661478 RepID=A0A068NRS9_FIMGI|nr:P-II family nitrogen regulator [Fimbriimonas ginsengisoli]AIE85470.1 Nitrogen regulatory protein P-II [Fimbriimonas ginsengisoli Gsoil 348]